MDRVDDLLLEWEERRDRGEPAGVDVLCPDDPALRRGLAERIRLLEAYDTLMALPGERVDPIPQRVGKYAIRGRLGDGGMGVVYDAWDPALARSVAVKMIHPRQLALAGPRASDRFAREGQALAKLRHANVVAVYEAGVHDGSPYLVMEHVAGGSLAARRARLTAAGPGAILPLMEKVALAVEYAHARGVLHRDLKPANVLLDDAGEPRVADFGLAALFTTVDTDPGARAGDDDTWPGVSVLTSDGAQPGTPAYQAPEQFDPTFGKVGPATDVWALGVMLYELLTGYRPFAEVSRSRLSEQVTWKPAPLLPNVPRKLADVVGRCLEKRPERRFRSAGELADALHRLHLSARRTTAHVALALALVLGCGAAVWGYGKWADGVTTSLQETGSTDPELDGYTDPEAVREAFGQLSRGEAVVLIDHGQPRSYRLGRGPGTGRVVAQDGRTTIFSQGECLVELLPRLPDGCWVVEARLRHTRAIHPAGEVGLYAGHSRRPQANGWQHFFGSVSFAERIQASANALSAGRARSRFRFLSDRADGEPDSHQRSVLNPSAPLGPVPVDHRLTITVDRTGLRPACDAVNCGLLGAELAQVFRGELQTDPSRQSVTPLDQFGAIGVVVQYGGVSVESVVVRPTTVTTAPDQQPTNPEPETAR